MHRYIYKHVFAWADICTFMYENVEPNQIIRTRLYSVQVKIHRYTEDFNVIREFTVSWYNILNVSSLS